MFKLIQFLALKVSFVQIIAAFWPVQTRAAVEKGKVVFQSK